MMQANPCRAKGAADHREAHCGNVQPPTDDSAKHSVIQKTDSSKLGTCMHGSDFNKFLTPMIWFRCLLSSTVPKNYVSLFKMAAIGQN